MVDGEFVMDGDSIVPGIHFVDEKQPKFWLVWSPDYSGVRSRHESYAEALVEAHRLAKSVPGQEFIILCAVSKITTVPVMQESSYE